MSTSLDLSKLKPCPFCGGGIFRVREQGKVWLGMKYSEPSTVVIEHFCENRKLRTPYIARVGCDLNDAIDSWNTRI